MKRVLIVCDLFPPAFGPRMGYLCKYLKPLGWEPVVVTEQVPSGGFEMLSHTCKVYAVDCYPAKRAWLRKWKWIAVQLISLFFDYKGWKLKRVARRVMGRERIYCPSDSGNPAAQTTACVDFPEAEFTRAECCLAGSGGGHDRFALACRYFKPI